MCVCVREIDVVCCGQTGHSECYMWPAAAGVAAAAENESLLETERRSRGYSHSEESVQ